MITDPLFYSKVLELDHLPDLQRKCPSIQELNILSTSHCINKYQELGRLKRGFIWRKYGGVGVS